MISALASPTVCVIDDEEADYRPILDALNSLYVGCVHIKGDSLEALPPTPFKGLRLVFTDLHLTGLTGKDAASHTANVFRKVVHADTAPVVVVIWSKYANDRVNDDVPPEDQETEAELFKRTLLEAENKFAGRLILLEMKKPKGEDRKNVNWFDAIGEQIKEVLEGKEAIDALLTWESLAKQAVLGVSEGITTLAQSGGSDPGKTLENIKTALRLLVRAQAENDLSPATAPRHLSSVLAQLLVDQLDHAEGVEQLAPHAQWLAEKEVSTHESSLKSNLNGFLLTMAVPSAASSFMPGTVYGGIDDENFRKLFGVKLGELEFQTFAKRTHDKEIAEEERKAIDKEDCKKWRGRVRPILIEVSPSCDVAQGVRRNALLLAGVIVPSELRTNAKRGEAFQLLPDFALREQMGDFNKQNVFLILCSRYKATLPEATVPDWLKPWFRLRELPTASLRSWHASHASRVGYVSL
jgi:hypothetical protein